MFPQRLLTAVALLSVFIGAMYVLPRVWWSAFLVPGLIVASMEWARLARCGRGQGVLFAAMTLASFLALLCAAELGARDWPSVNLPATLTYLAATVFWLAIVPIWLAAGWRTRHPVVLGVAGWLVLVPTWLALVEMQAAPSQSLFVLGVVWIADTAAYLVGRRFGRHRLAPTISPGKTWEGVAGAGLAVAVYYALAWAAGFPQNVAWNVAGGSVVVVMVAVMSIEGDLFESWMKRQAGVKDSGTLLPGHGGLLDRIDGLTASVPAVVLLMQVLPATMSA